MTNAEKYAQELARDTEKMIRIIVRMDCIYCPARTHCLGKFQKAMKTGERITCWTISKEWLEMEAEENYL